MNHKVKGALGAPIFAMALVLLMNVLVAAQDVKTNYMPGTDFTKYHTYKWVNVEGAEQPDPILDQQIRLAIDGQMASKGFIKTDNEKADIYVAYQASVTQEKQWNAYGMGGGPRWGGGMATATSSTIEIGTLGLDFYDPATKQLIWRGQATKTLNPSKNPEKNQERLNKAVAKLMKDFPPKSK